MEGEKISMDKIITWGGMYVRKMRLLLVAVVVLLMTGCGDTEIIDETTSSQIESTTETQSKEYIYDDITEISKNSGTAFSEKGYYYLVNGVLYFYDVNESVGSPICNKEGCLHRSDGCEAYILDKVNYDIFDLKGVDVKCLGNMIWYDSGKLYMIKRDENGDYLMQYDSDFTNEVKLATLAEKGSVVGLAGSDTENSALLYDGYLYFFSMKLTNSTELIDYMATVYCNRIEIKEGAQIEELGSFQMAIDYAMGKGNYGEVCAGKNGVFFSAGGVYRPFSNNNEVQYRINYYDCEKNTFDMLININADYPYDVLGKGSGKAIRVNGDITCADDEDNLYVVTDNKKIVKISASGETRVVYANSNAKNISSLIWDGEYIYFFEKYANSGAIVRMDKTGARKDKYMVTVNNEFCREHNIKSLEVDMVICGVDAQNIVVSTDSNCITGLECEQTIANSVMYTNTYAVGIMSKAVFEEESESIKCIYKYK